MAQRWTAASAAQTSEASCAQYSNRARSP
jgi:hypothetical protein